MFCYIKIEQGQAVSADIDFMVKLDSFITDNNIKISEENLAILLTTNKPVFSEGLGTYYIFAAKEINFKKKCCFGAMPSKSVCKI